MKNPRAEWTVKKVSLDKANLWHFKLNQVHQGIPVRGGHLSLVLTDGVAQPGTSVSLDEAIQSEEAGVSTVGRLVYHGEYFDDLNDQNLDTKPVLTDKQAMQMVRQLLRKSFGTKGNAGDKTEKGASPHLRVDDPGQGNDDASLEIHSGNGPGKRKLTYHVVANDTSASGEPIQLHAWVGAQADNAGQILESYNNIQTSDLLGTGRTFYQGVASYFHIDFSPAAGSYVLNDEAQRIGAYDAYSSCSATYQASSGTTIFGNFALSNRNSTNADTLLGTVQTMSYYYYNHGRNRVDGVGGPKVYAAVDGLGSLLSARNHVCSNYNNAYWDGQKINIGDGDGVSFRSFASLDVIAHEWTHGVTQFEANLNYSGESGALNESFSDIFGAMTERYWRGDRFISCPADSRVGAGVTCSLTGQIGEEIYTPTTPGDALRYMYAPTLDGSSKDYYPSRYTGTADNGGVHTNSGIQNNAFWLLAYGGCHRVKSLNVNRCMNASPSVNGIGADAAKKIFYLALRDYLIPTDGFYWARQGTQYEAGTLYGFTSPQYYATKRAWDLVGAP